MALPSLAAAYFMMGVSSTCVVGLVALLTHDLHVSPGAVALFVTAYGVVYALSAPLLQMAFGHWERRALIMTGLGTMLVALIACAAAPSYGAMFGARMVLGAGGSLIGSMVAATAASLVPAERRTQAVGTVFTGITLSSVMGVPIATWLGGVIGWRGVMLLLAAGCAVVLLVVRASVPAGSRGGRVTGRAIIGALTDPVIASGLAVTFFHMGGMYATYAMIAVYLTEVHGVAPWLIKFAIFGAGLGGLLGNRIAVALSHRIEIDRLILFALVSIAGALVLLALAPPTPWLLLPITFLWFIAYQVALTPHQARLIGVSGTAGNIVMAFNASFLNLGLACGAASAGFFYEHVGGWVLPWTSVGLILAGVASFLVSRRAEIAGRRRIELDAELVPTTGA